jgi:Ser/Thr protein kinase RdoA (MazF antagonist)
MSILVRAEEVVQQKNIKPFEELSHLGRIQRMRQLAHVALNSYDLPDVRFKLLRQAGNILFKVNEVNPVSTTQVGLYEPGQYLLRIHQPGYQTTEAIELELAWLAAMCREAHLPVPEPVPTREGKPLVQVSIPGIPGSRNCSLYRWLKGRYITKNIRPDHFRAQGRLIARLHNFAAHWQPPADISKRKYDWDGLFRDDDGAGMPASEAWSLLPRECIKPYEQVASKVKQVMQAWGQGPDVYGLIHADLGLDANVLFWDGEARAIDFDDSGFGYYLYDLALALEHCQEDEALPQFRDALLDGYTQVRSLSIEQIKYLELFLSAFCVYLSLWAVAGAHLHPAYREELLRRMERALRIVERYI